MNTNEDIFRALRTKSPDEFFSTPGLNLSVVGELGRTLLHVAIGSRKFDSAALLIEKGAPLDVQDNNGQTPLHFACTFNAEDLARQILARGGAPDVVDKFGNGALWAAAVLPKKNYALIDLLISHGASCDRKNKAGLSVLDSARRSGNKKLWMSCGGKEDEF